MILMRRIYVYVPSLVLTVPQVHHDPRRRTRAAGRLARMPVRANLALRPSVDQPVWLRKEPATVRVVTEIRFQALIAAIAITNAASSSGA
ncbi:hypothetical protein GCM10023075_05200 [Streptosporangium album]